MVLTPSTSSIGYRRHSSSVSHRCLTSSQLTWLPQGDVLFRLKTGHHRLLSQINQRKTAKPTNVPVAVDLRCQNTFSNTVQPMTPHAAQSGQRALSDKCKNGEPVTTWRRLWASLWQPGCKSEAELKHPPKKKKKHHHYHCYYCSYYPQ